MISHAMRAQILSGTADPACSNHFSTRLSLRNQTFPAEELLPADRSREGSGHSPDRALVGAQHCSTASDKSGRSRWRCCDKEC